jgi:F-type H+-transporting ATPase subunit a
VSVTLEDVTLLQLGPVRVTESLVMSAAIGASLVLVSRAVTRRLAGTPGRLQGLLELVVSTIADQIEQVTGEAGAPHVPLLGTLFLFIAASNLTLLVPGLHPPTEHPETPLALALVVLAWTHVAGIRAQGLAGDLRHYLEPSPVLAPLHVLSELTRTFSLTVRLFGNMMSHGLILAVVLALAGLLVPVPLVALGLLTGLIQAYIFTILATTYVGAAVAVHRKGGPST